MWLQYILIRLTSSIPLPHLVEFQQLSLFYFQRRVQNTSTIFTFSIYTHTHTSTHPRQDLFSLPVLHFLSAYRLFRGVLPLVFQTRIYLALLRLTPFITFSISLPPIIQQFPVHFIILFSYTDVTYFSTIHYHSVFLFCLPIVASNRPTNAITLY
jgi:hypothetical protein